MCGTAVAAVREGLPPGRPSSLRSRSPTRSSPRRWKRRTRWSCSCSSGAWLDSPWRPWSTLSLSSGQVRVLLNPLSCFQLLLFPSHVRFHHSSYSSLFFFSHPRLLREPEGFPTGARAAGRGAGAAGRQRSPRGVGRAQPDCDRAGKCLQQHSSMVQIHSQ